MTDGPRVLVLHNRYRVRGGEERAVELQLRALERAGLPSALLERDSSAAGRGRAARALLRGGEDGGEVADAARALGATVVHCHNMQPLLGPRALSAAHDAGARVVLNLHNFRLFCAIGVAYRDGERCYDCHDGHTLPGLVHNCRGSRGEAGAYALALRRQLPDVLASVDRFVAPSAHAVDQLVRLGLPRERIGLLRHYLPAGEFAARSDAAEGEFVLIAGRLAREKGLEQAVEAAALAEIPLRIAGDGPLEPRLRELIASTGADAQLLGRLDPDALRALRRRAAVVAMPSLWDEIAPYAVLEAMAGGLPIVASRVGGLPELVGDQRCVAAGDVRALADSLRALWDDPSQRRQDGEALLARAHGLFSEERYVADLRELYSA